MNLKYISLSALAVSGLFGAALLSPAADAGAQPANASAIVTVESSHGKQAPSPLAAENLLIYTGKTPARITTIQPMGEASAKTQLFIYLDDSTRQGALGPRIGELRSFIASLPANVDVAVGYMRNGGFSLQQPFTSDHAKAAQSVRLPVAVPGLNGSPYFALSYLVKHWPSTEQVDRKAVLMLTDGVDRYYSDNFSQDPYVDASIKDSQHFGVVVSSIYLTGSGVYAESGFGQTMSQSRLDQVARATGGQAYFEGLQTPVSLTPYLNQFADRLNRQYRVAFIANENAGLQRIAFRSEIPGIKVSGPSEVLVRNDRS